MRISNAARLSAAILAFGTSMVGGFLQAQQIVLVPGTIGGVATIGALPISQISISASPQGGGSTSSFNVSPNIVNAPDPMTVSVPENGTATYNLTGTIRTDSNRDAIRFNTSPVTVSATTPGVKDFILNEPGFIAPSFTVIGSATISSVSLTATFSASGVFEQASTSVSAGANYSFPAIPRDNMTLSGTVLLSNNLQVQLQQQTINVVANQTTQVSFTVDGSVTGSIGGTIQVRGPQPSTGWTWPPTDRPLGRSSSSPPPANGGYSVGPLAPGTYSLSATARFNNFDDAFSFPSAAYTPGRFNITVGTSETNVNLSSQQAFANGIVQLTGAASLQPFVNGGQVNLSGTAASTTGGSSSDQLVAATRAFDLIASAGTWRFSQAFVSFFRPAPFLSGSFSYFDNRPSNTMTLVAGDTASIDVPIELGEVTLTITVAGGGTFSNPSVSGSCTQRDQQNTILWSSSFSFSTSNQNNVTQGSVTFATPSGQCTITPRVVIDGQTDFFRRPTLAVAAGIR